MSTPANPFLGVQDPELLSEQFAREEDEKDQLSQLRGEFIIPTKADLKHQRYGPAPTANADGTEDGIYLCGNSLGLQPRRTRQYIQKYLDTWASKGVFGHFKEFEDGHPPWLHLDDAVKAQTANIVGASPSEVAVMETLTANLHLLMASFYKPTKDRYKIIIEGKAFPSDHVSCPPVGRVKAYLSSMPPSRNSPTIISLLLR
jgi:kynureninase